jgi:hypothetical protein
MSQAGSHSISHAGGSRIGAITALVGSALLAVGTLLHPSVQDPNNAPAAFAEYAAFGPWVAVHLMQLVGVVLIMASLVLLARRLIGGSADEWATLAAVGASATIAVYAALQAVDGIALRGLVSNWVSAPEPDKAAAFQAALAVRHVEIGLSSIGDLLGGLTILLCGLALLVDGRAPRWMGILALAGGAPMAIAGVVIAYTGFSDLELTTNMVADGLVMVWLVALAICALRRASVWQQPQPT